MHDLYDELTMICETLSNELGKTNEKLSKSNGNISGADIDYINKLTHAIKSVKTSKAMMEAEDGGSYGSYGMSNRGSYEGSSNRGSYEGSSNRGSYEGGSYARGRGRNAKRDSMGRYSSERGYSRDNDEMIMELRELMEEAPDERMRQELQRTLNKIQSM